MAYDRWFNTPLVVFTAFPGNMTMQFPEYGWDRVNGGDGTPRCIRKFGDFYILGTYGGSRIYYTTDMTKGWTAASVPKVSSYDNCAMGLVCTEDKIVAAGYASSGSATWPIVLYAPSPSGPWTAKTLQAEGLVDGVQITKTCYGRGYGIAYGPSGYVIAYHDYGKISVLYTQDPAAARWGIRADSLAGANPIPSDVLYANGLYVMCGNVGNQAYVAYSPTADAAWSLTYIDTGNAFTTSRMLYANGYYVIVGNVYVSSYNYNLVVYYATSPAGPWTKRVVVPYASQASCSLLYAAGYWLLFYQAGGMASGAYASRVCYTDDLAQGEWKSKAVDNGSYLYSASYYENGLLTAVGAYVGYTTIRTAYADFPFSDM